MGLVFIIFLITITSCSLSKDLPADELLEKTVRYVNEIHLKVDKACFEENSNNRKPEICRDFYNDLHFRANLGKADIDSFNKNIEFFMQKNHHYFGNHIGPLFYIFPKPEVFVAFLSSDKINHKKLYQQTGFNFTAYFITQCNKNIVLKIIEKPIIKEVNEIWLKSKLTPLDLYSEKCS